MKHMKKIKYFWRGTNFNYPYTFVKLKPEKLLTKPELEELNQKNSIKDEKMKEKNKFFVKIQEYSKKKINPTASFYKWV